jgi:hypothetical protein
MQLLGLCNSDEDIQRLFWRSTYGSVLSSLLSSLALFPVTVLAVLNWSRLYPLRKRTQNSHFFNAATRLRRAPNKLSEAILSLLVACNAPTRPFGFYGRREVAR